MNRYLAAWLTTWSMARSRKSTNSISTTGRRAGDGGAGAEAHEPGLAQGRVDDAAGAELGEQALGDLVGAAALADPLADAEHGLVPLHLLPEGGAEGLAVLDLGHRSFRRWPIGCGGPSPAAGPRLQVATSARKASTEGSGLAVANSTASSISASTRSSIAAIAASSTPARGEVLAEDEQRVVGLPALQLLLAAGRARGRSRGARRGGTSCTR